MLNVLKSAVVYTVTYIAIFTCTLWFLIFLILTVQVFWKVFLAIFAVIFALFTWDFVKARNAIAPKRWRYGAADETVARDKGVLYEIIAISEAHKS